MIPKTSPMGQDAFRLCHGLGLEIGPLHQPFELDATMIYLDREDYDRLCKSYLGDSRSAKITAPHLIASNVPYDFISKNTFDFVISSHSLEHFANPGLALEEWVRITKPGGIVYCILPNRNETFDRNREVTPPALMLEAWKSRDPIAPIAQYVDFYMKRVLSAHESRPEGDFIERMWKKQHSIHVYTWIPENTSAFFETLGRGVGFEIVFKKTESINIHIVIRKVPASLPANFDPEIYLSLNPDVAKSGYSAAGHYMKYGFKEGRKFKGN